MIVFEKLRCKNMFAVGNQWLELSLNTHATTLIQGDNGSGKTSLLLDSLVFCLYGKAYRNINLSQIVNSINQKECVVEVEFSVGSNHYLVRRGLAPKVFVIEKNNKPLPEDSASTDQQAYLEKQILKISYKSFIQIILLGSMKFTSFMTLKSGDRKEVIENLLDLQVFGKMSDNLKIRSADLKERENDFDNRMSLAQSEVIMIEDFNRTSKENNDETIKELQNRIDTAKDKIKANTARIQTYQSEIDDINLQLKDASKEEVKLRKLQELYHKISTVMGKLQQEISFFEKNLTCPTCSQNISEETKNNTLLKKETKKKEVESALSDLNGQMAETKKTLDSFTERRRKIDDLNMERSQFQIDNESQEWIIKTATRDMEKVKTSTKTDVGNLEESKEALAKLVIERDKLTNERYLFDLASAILCETGVRTKLVERYLPLLNAKINANLNRFGFLVDFNIGADFKEQIRSRFRDEFSFESFSTGERIRIDIAVLLAFREIAEKRNSLSTNLLVLDEVMSNLDADSSDELQSIVTELGKKGNIFLISHRTDLAKDKFSRVVNLKKQGDFTIIGSNDD